jgi:integrase
MGVFGSGKTALTVARLFGQGDRMARKVCEKRVALSFASLRADPLSMAKGRSTPADSGQLTVCGVNQLLTRLKERGKLEGKCNPHAFRHGFAIQYVMNGGDLATLSDLMGHESVQTTKDHYAMFKREELRRKHDEFSAVARMARDGRL